MAARVRFHFQLPKNIMKFCKTESLHMATKFLPTQCVKYTDMCQDGVMVDVGVRLWELSDFNSIKTVGISGDDNMYHILVIWYISKYVIEMDYQIEVLSHVITDSHHNSTKILYNVYTGFVDRSIGLSCAHYYRCLCETMIYVKLCQIM